MKIKKGWIYKYNDWCTGKPFTLDWVNDSKSICPYFWKSLWNICAYISLFIGWQFFFGLVGLSLFEKLGIMSLDSLSTLPWYLNWGTFLISAIAFTAGFLILLGVAAAIVAGIFLLVEKISRKVSYDISEDETNNVVIAWVKAKKSKICPMIEWED